MKKSLIASLAAALVFSVAGTSFAASNPFVDVPQGHWAYGYLNQLAKAHMIDGFNDGTFRGEQNMTRYEMATLVAKAMAKSDKADAQSKAALEKLQVEFASELQNLGVRVDNLEKKVGNIKLTGDARIRYVSVKDAATNPTFAERFRLNMAAAVNDNTSFYGRYEFMNHNAMGTQGVHAPNGKETTDYLADANFTTKNVLGITDVTVGRYTQALGPTAYFTGGDGGWDGIKVASNMGKASLVAGYADVNVAAQGFAPTTTVAAATDGTLRNVKFGEFGYKFNNDVKSSIVYFKSDKGSTTAAYVPYTDLGLTVTANILPNVVLTGEYYKNSADAAKVNGNDPKAYIAKVAYKGASAAVPGSFGLAFEYIKFEVNANPYLLTGAQLNYVNNVKAMDVQFSYGIAKNMTFDAFYQFNVKKTTDNQTWIDGKNYTRLQVNYMF